MRQGAAMSCRSYGWLAITFANMQTGVQSLCKQPVSSKPETAPDFPCAFPNDKGVLVLGGLPSACSEVHFLHH